MTSQPRGKSRDTSAVGKLPFVGPRKNRRKKQSPRCFWHNVVSTGDVIKDHEIGSQYAYFALQAIKAENFAPLLGWIVLDMIEHKCPADIVVGFFQTVADVCLDRHAIPPASRQLQLPQ